MYFHNKKQLYIKFEITYCNYCVEMNIMFCVSNSLAAIMGFVASGFQGVSLTCSMPSQPVTLSCH